MRRLVGAAAVQGLALGAVIYATYEFTNLSVSGVGGGVGWPGEQEEMIRQLLVSFERRQAGTGQART
jgi:hypothetical protein